MKFKKLLSILFTVGMLAACGQTAGGGGGGGGASYTDKEDGKHTIVVNNLEEMMADWMFGEAPRTIDLSLKDGEEDKAAILELGAGNLSFSVADQNVISITGLVFSAVGEGSPTSGNLTRWAEQGVLLLNASLTVRAHQANSHSTLGWQKFTDAAIQALATQREHLVYMLWGGYARSKAYMIDKNSNLVLESVHPSPLSANRGGWFGLHQFSRCNAYLEQNGKTPIIW